MKYNIQVSVRSEYLPSQSSPQNSLYLFAYFVTISNLGMVATQVISRHWIITDESLKIEEVKGLGVVGYQPLIKPNETFTYSSSCPLTTETGTMKGSYFCVAEDGERFEAQIKEFALFVPKALN
jgi:ApaG protein